jgi:Zn-dependent protease
VREILLELLLFGVPAVFAITLHEAAHGYAAWALGDDTARRLGRFSLNPLRHVDRVGTLLVPGLLVVVQLLTLGRIGFMFGWAKPVPVDPRNLRNPQIGMAVIAAAGPLTNFVIAAAFAAVLVHGTYTGVAYEVLGYAFVTNVVLGVFNLLPIPPLDGSRIAGAFMTRETWLAWSRLDQYGMFAILALVLVLRDPFSQFMQDATNRVAEVIGALVGGNPLA